MCVRAYVCVCVCVSMQMHVHAYVYIWHAGVGIVRFHPRLYSQCISNVESVNTQNFKYACACTYLFTVPSHVVSTSVNVHTAQMQLTLVSHDVIF